MDNPPDNSQPNQEEEIFLAALDLPLPERAAFLAKACGTDTDLQRGIEELLAAHASPALPDSPDSRIGPQPGDLVDHYHLVKKIGEGGFGEVWLARDERLRGREVALKIIKPGMDTREVVSRFKLEQHTLALLDNPFIVRVLEAGATESGQPFFVMELVQNGVTITRYCDEKNLGLSERLKLFEMVCQGIQYAHQKGIIHRDLKPSNVLITEVAGAPIPKIIDFGIARAVGGRSLIETAFVTQKLDFIGSLAYASPEQIQGADNIDIRTDIYSLGLLLYELLTGERQFDFKPIKHFISDEAKRQICEVDPPLPSIRLITLSAAKLTEVARCRAADPARLPRLVLGDLDWVTMKALEKEPDNRFSSCSEIAAQIHRYLNHLPLDRPPSWSYVFGKFVKRHPLAFRFTLGCLLLFFVAGFWYLRWPGSVWVISVSPPDAEMFIDGQPTPLHQFPWTFKLPAGRYEMQFSKPGYTNVNVSLVVQRGRTLPIYPVMLHHAQGTVNVTTSPVGAGIHLDNVDYYQKISELTKDAGRYQVDAYASDCFDQHRSIEIPPGGRASLEFVLEKGRIWKYTSPATQSGLIIVTNREDPESPVIVHNEFNQMIFIDSASGAILSSNSTSYGNARFFQQLDLGGTIGKVIVSAFESPDPGISVTTLASTYPVKTNWVWQGPGKTANQNRKASVVTVPGESNTANLAAAGADGRVWLLDGRSGTPLLSNDLAATSLVDIPYMSAWQHDQHPCLMAVFQIADRSLDHAGTPYHAAAFDETSGAKLWEKIYPADAKFLFADLHRDGVPWLIHWRDYTNSWEIIDPVNGVSRGSRTLPANIKPGRFPRLIPAADGTGCDLAFQLDNDQHETIVTKPFEDFQVRRVPDASGGDWLTGPDNTILQTVSGDWLSFSAAALTAINSTHNTVDWQIKGSMSGALYYTNNGNIYLTMDETGLLCLNSSGQTNWLLRLQDQGEPWAVLPGGNSKTGCDNILFHKHAEFISLVHAPCVVSDWVRTANGRNLEATPLIAHDEQSHPIVLQSGAFNGSCSLRAFEGATGYDVWSGAEHMDTSRAPSLAQLKPGDPMSLIEMGLPDGTPPQLVIRQASNGRLIHVFDIPIMSSFSGASAVADFRACGQCDVAVSSSDDPQIALINSQTGKLLWQYHFARRNFGFLAAGSLETNGAMDVIVSSASGETCALRGADGSVLWRTADYPSYARPLVAQLDADGPPDVLISSYDGRLFVLGGKSGELLWSPEIKGGSLLLGTPSVVKDHGKTTILAPLGTAGVVAFDWPSRAEIWRSPAGNPSITTPAVSDITHSGKKEVVMATTDGNILVLDFTTGNLLCKIKVSDKSIEADPVVCDLDGDGLEDIIVACLDSKLCAINGRRLAGHIH